VKDIYLIPANTKKGQLIFNMFTPLDLIIFGTGIAISFILLLVIGTDTIPRTIIILIPALFTALLVMPIPNYHNVITFSISMYKYFTNQRKYLWKGWRFYEFTKEDSK
jgi:hypothetical protein